MAGCPSPFGLTPSLVLSINPPAGCWWWLTVVIPELTVPLTWEGSMDTSTTPANGSWTLTADGVPTPVVSQNWVSPTVLNLINPSVEPEPTTVTLSYAGGDPGLRTSAGKIVEPFDLDGLPHCP